MRPCMNAAGEVDDVGETVTFQKRCHRHAAGAVMADADDLLIFFQLIEASGDGLHRDRLGAGYVASLILPRLAHVQQDLAQLDQQLAELRKAPLLMAQDDWRNHIR